MRENRRRDDERWVGRGVVRDIRDDLVERIEAVKTEMAGLRTQYDQDRRELEAKFSDQFGRAQKKFGALQILLEDEIDAVPSPSRGELKYRLPLQDFILNGLNSVPAMSKDEVRDMVERAGYVGPNESAGRMVHTTLLNLKNADKIVLMADGQYEIKTRVAFRGDRLRSVPLEEYLPSIGMDTKDESPPADEADGQDVFD